MDLSRLSRDYKKFPIKIGELLSKEDFEYLYLEENLSHNEIAALFNRESCWSGKHCKKYGIKKSRELLEKCKVRVSMLKYGVPYPTQNAKIKNKITNTIHNFSDEYKKELSESSSKLMKNIWANRTQEEKENISNKYKTTWNSKSNEEKQERYQKISNTWNNKTDEELKEYSEKIRDICNNRSDSQKLEISNKHKQIWKNRTSEERNLIKNKISNTWNNKSTEEKQAIKDKYMSQIDGILQKTYKTKKLHNSFHKSGKEDKILTVLRDIFPSTIDEYYSDRYPFKCDFYIPELDLFIEYQGHPTHGPFPYVEDDTQCKELLETWKTKSESKFYQNMIHIWTISDPHKREVARKNSLNWIEFFTYEDFLNWVEKDLIKYKET